MLFDLPAQARQLGGLPVVEHGRAAAGFRHRLLCGARFGPHGHHALLGGFAAQHAACGLVHDERVGRHQPAHNGFAQAPGGGEHGLVAAAGDGVGGEQDAGRVGQYQGLHYHRQCDGVLVNVVLQAIADGARCPQAGPALFDGGQHGLGAADVKVSLLLAGKGEFRVRSFGQRER